jgi:hypothetical protein
MSNIHTIREKLYQRYPDVPPEVLDEIILYNFKAIRKAVGDLNKLMIVTPFGNLYFTEYTAKKLLVNIEHKIHRYKLREDKEKLSYWLLMRKKIFDILRKIHYLNYWGRHSLSIQRKYALFIRDLFHSLKLIKHEGKDHNP